MYPKDAYCDTCKLHKPPRSKHCSVCGVCVPHFDHHCVWLNRCVTKHNYLIFLAFVFQHVLICAYGSICYILALMGELYKDQVLQFKNGELDIFDQYSTIELPLVMLKYVINFNWENKIMGTLAMFDMSCALTLPFFLLYHLRCALINRTTNEDVKSARLHFGLKNQ